MLNFLIAMVKPSHRVMESQMEVFLEWGRRNSIASYTYKEFLDLFLETTNKTDVQDLSFDDVDFFIQIVHNRYAGTHSRITARKAIEALMRFYMARSNNGKAKLGKGRPPHIGEIEQAQKYRKMGLSIKDIGKLMGKHLSHVHRWIHYPLDSQK